MKSRTAVDGVDYEDEEALGPLLPGTNHSHLTTSQLIPSFNPLFIVPHFFPSAT